MWVRRVPDEQERGHEQQGGNGDLTDEQHTARREPRRRRFGSSRLSAGDSVDDVAFSAGKSAQKRC